MREQWGKEKAVRKPKTGRALLIASTAAMPLLVEPAHADPGDSQSVTALKALGKNLFFDTKLSIPANTQACASCHNAAVGGILPNSAINATTVVAPGAAPHALGNLRPPTNIYATDIARFQTALGFGVGTANNLVVLPGWGGGNFWDGRAEGCGASAPSPNCPVIKDPGAAVSETIKFGDLPDSRKTAPNDFTKFLGP